MVDVNILYKMAGIRQPVPISTKKNCIAAQTKGSGAKAMNRYQKTAEKPSQNPKTPEGRLDKLQSKVDSSIDQYITREYNDAELLLVPQDLQTSDPSLLSEIKSGHFGLDGMFVEVGEGRASVFASPDADDSFNRVLLGFGWLRDMSARGDFNAQIETQQLVFEWIEEFSQAEGISCEPQVMASRITSFLSNSPLILRGIRKKRTRLFMRTLVQQIEQLYLQLNETPKGLPRLDVLSALVRAGLCLSRHEKLLLEATPLLLRELKEQVLPDGSHCSRNPGALLHILFEILPLKQCYTGRGKDVPEELDNAISAMIEMIRFFRMGDSSLARFNGHSTTPTNALATLLVQVGQQSESAISAPQIAPDSGYCRLQDGPLVLLCDVGSPPPVNIDARAHAGCLSIELSVRHFALVVNAGAYMGEDETWRHYSRSTRAHSTLTVDNHSSGGFLDNGHLLGPHDVLISKIGPLALKASHKGYESHFGLTHHRTCVLSHEGLRLSGTDRLKRTSHDKSAADNVQFQIRFHLHPFIELAESDGDNLLLTLPDGEIWRFTARGAKISVEDSIYLAYRSGPKAIHQIILEGDAGTAPKVSWIFEQYRERPAPS